MIVQTRWPLWAKRGFDLIVSLIALPLLVPVLVVCATAICIDSPGPPIFTQLRTGRNGSRFRMFKFRTMVRNAPELKASLAHLNILPPPDFKVIDDPRITRVGTFLRRTSLDELPQVVNVILGQMSLVGPRPTSFAAGTYELWQTERLEVTPGITGLWQVEGRNHMTFEERLRLDIDYVHHMSPRLDASILARTVRSVVGADGA